MRRCALILTLLAAASTCLGSQLAVIVNPSVTTDSLDQRQLRDYYTGDLKFWEDGAPVVLFDLKPRLEIKRAFYDYLGKSSSRIKSIWLKRKLSGEGDPPDALESEAEVVKKVARTPGALGFVSLPEVTDSVKTILVIEISAEQSGSE